MSSRSPFFVVIIRTWKYIFRSHTTRFKVLGTIFSLSKFSKLTFPPHNPHLSPIKSNQKDTKNVKFIKISFFKLSVCDPNSFIRDLSEKIRAKRFLNHGAFEGLTSTSHRNFLIRSEMQVEGVLRLTMPKYTNSIASLGN